VNVSFDDAHLLEIEVPRSSSIRQSLQEEEPVPILHGRAMLIAPLALERQSERWVI
jgi:hypothetical protein